MVTVLANLHFDFGGKNPHGLIKMKLSVERKEFAFFQSRDHSRQHTQKKTYGKGKLKRQKASSEFKDSA